MSGRRGWRWGLGLAVGWFVLAAVGVAVLQAEVWDLRAHAEDPIDASWRLELAWKATRGDWSGLDFHYPRGPLWQAFGWVAATLAEGNPPWTLALLYLVFHLATLGLLLALTLKLVPAGWARVAVFIGCATLSNASGVATFRGFLPLVVLFLYAPRALEEGEDPRPWRSAFAAAAVTAAASLVSFDRLYAIGFCVAAAAGFELAVRWRRGDPVRPALARVARFGGACLVCFAGVAALALALGADPVEALLAQRALAGAYSSHMATEWRVAVPPANVAGVFLASLALAALPRLQPGGGRARLDAIWLGGALPAVSFGLIRADEGHMILSMIPALVVLFFLAGGASPALPGARRLLAGVLASVAVVGWFGTYPSNLAGHPRVGLELAALARGEKRPDLGYRTEHGAAIAWARERAAEDPDACIGASADMSLVHPFADLRGPSELAMRWSHRMKTELADAIERADCPHYVYSLKTYDYPGDSWALGPDFVRVAQRYAVERRLGAGLLGMRRRARPLAVERRAVARDAAGGELALPAEVRVRLDERVRGTDLVEVALRIDVPRWRVLAGGAPHVEWRFEADGAPIGEWDHLYQVMIGEISRVQVSPDPEAAEHWWMTGRPPPRRREADTLALRVSARGVASPDVARLEIARVDRLRLEREPAPPPSTCDGRVDLLDALRGGEAFARYVSPSPGPEHFDLEPSPPNRKLAEVTFPITPCPDTCFFFGASVAAPPERSDGVEVEAHVLDLPDRVLLRRAPIPPGGEERRFELPLDGWGGRSVLLRVGTRPGEAYGDDYAKIVRPRLDRCTARRTLAEADETGALILRGAGRRRGEDLLVGPAGAEAELPITVVRGTCFHAAVRTRGEAPVRVTVRTREGALEHVAWDGEIAPGSDEALRSVDLFDFTTRPVSVIVEVRPLGDSRAELIRPRLGPCP